MDFKQILRGVKVKEIVGTANPAIENITFDSREVEAGSLFIAVKGENIDGSLFIEEAVERGAVAIVTEEKPKKELSVDVAIIESSREAVAKIASNFYRSPSSRVKVIAITGTNGKTTTATLLYDLFMRMGYRAGLISTIENRVGDKIYPAKQTTPDAITIERLIAQMAKEGVEFCFMEVSSHALDQSRVNEIYFEGALFTNITHDHLDYHGDFLSYLNSKKRLFDQLSPTSFALYNSDDRNGEVMVQNFNGEKYNYSCHSPASFHCKIIETSIDGMQLQIDGKEMWSTFIGEYNAHNLLAVYATATLLGLEKEQLLTTLSGLTTVPGRLEYIKGGENITAVVDYAHTADALKNVLKSLVEVAQGAKVITLFGCGGDRDRAKRAEMAKVTAQYSDRIVVTSDNPRSEEPNAIIKEIMKGFSESEEMRVMVIPDRREAIKVALTTAPANSIVLIAGKGHEQYQEIKGVRHPFDDREEVKTIFNKMER